VIARFERMSGLCWPCAIMNSILFARNWLAFVESSISPLRSGKVQAAVVNRLAWYCGCFLRGRPFGPLDRRNCGTGARRGTKAGTVCRAMRAARPSNLLGDIVPSRRLGHPSLLLDRVCRQLQHRRSLPGNEVGDQNDCTV